jgi:hypothetical protein
MEDTIIKVLSQEYGSYILLIIFGGAVIRHLAARDLRHEGRMEKLNEQHREDIKEITNQFTASIDGVRDSLEALTQKVNGLEKR